MLVNSSYSMDDILSKPLTPTYIFLFLIFIEFQYQYGFRYLPLFESLTYTFINAILYLTILFLTMRLDLVRSTLGFLALPYLIFIPGWLNLPTIIALTPIFIICMARALKGCSAAQSTSITFRDFFAFILILIWVNLSGIGGYGHATPDYLIHSVRLKDLINYSWPVHYKENQNLVYYVGYFLPSAIIGKISTSGIALHSLYPWTVLGVTLALRWLSLLSGWRFSSSLVIIFILFGPLDVINVLALDYQSADSLKSAISEILINSDYLDFRTRFNFGFFIGNYLSNTYQLFWSPHQVIAGWLVASLLTYLFIKKQTAQFIFIYALLCLWSPLIMIALSPLVLIAILFQLTNRWRNLITLENTLGAGTLIILFMVFYLGGSAGANASSWIFDAFNLKNNLSTIFLFYASAWGLYLIVIIPFAIQERLITKIWLTGLFVALLTLPIKRFGAYSDLLCRGSAPLMFLLLTYMLCAARHYWLQKRHGLLALLFCLLVTGTGSSLLQLRTAIKNYGVNPEATFSLPDYIFATENMGADNSLFNHLFRGALSDEHQPTKK